MKKNHEKGIGEKSQFSSCHPAVNMVFFLFAITITMFSNDPIFLVITIVFSWWYSILLRGKEGIKFNIIVTVPVFLFMALINTLFTHNGATVLFYISDNRITLEAFIFGAASALLLSAIIVWFSCFNVVMSSDKIIYIFGKAAPVLGLTFSMIFRFIPLLKNRYREISLGQKCMGRHGEKGLMNRTRQLVKEVSILISWSLEASIETADSMEARGYGLHGRTSFHLFKFSGRDKKMMAILLISGVIALIGCGMGETSIYYYPVIRMAEWSILRIASLLAYCALLASPLIMDILGEKRWQRLRYEI